jgi:hypothetical protein
MNNEVFREIIKTLDGIFNSHMILSPNIIYDINCVNEDKMSQEEKLKFFKTKIIPDLTIEYML